VTPRALRPWLTPPGLWLVTAPCAALLLLHYLTPADPHAHHAAGGPPVPLHLFHDLYRRLSYLPIVTAALLMGARGGLGTAAAVSLAYLPHVWYRWDELPTQRWDAIFEIVLYHAMGGLVGALAEALRRQRDALQQADRLRGAGELAAAMAHEVRNPLASISGAAERLRRGDLPDAERAELLDIVRREADRLEGVVREFLAYARPAPLTRVPTDPLALVRETATLVAATARRRGIDVVVAPEGDGAPALVAMDPARVKQALLNLLLNAVQASPDGSPVTVAVRSGPGGIEFRVTDRGAGVPPAAAARLFEPFVTTKPGGTGLGLPVARQIAEAHGGRLSLEPAEGGGTTARLALPARVR
jgi:two-component system sensor histidine kinase HydH